MGNRLSRIYTGTGDAGETGLGDGSRTPKTAPRIGAIGDVDELNCVVGLLCACELPGALAETLLTVQHDLFDLGGELSIPGMTLITEVHIERVERAIDALNADLPPLKEFILPGGSQAAATCHLARAVCRRAERSVLGLRAAEPAGGAPAVYLNRLSDYLFVAARVLARASAGGEVLWDRQRSAADS